MPPGPHIHEHGSASEQNYGVNAFLRRCQAQGVFTTIVKRGDGDAGLVMLKLFSGRDHVETLIETRNETGAMAWRLLTQTPVGEAQADETLDKQTAFDRDLWIVEVESSDGRALLDDPVLS